MQKQRSILSRIDWWLLLLCVLAAGYGLLLVTSATSSFAASRQMVITHASAVVLGIVLYIVISFIDVKIYSKFWMLIAVFNILFIAILFFWGIDNGGGNNNWLDFSFLPFNIQPTEVVSVTFILLLAMHFAALGNKVNRPWAVLSLVTHVGFMAVLNHIASGDTGTGLLFFFILLIMAFFSTMKVWWLLGGAVTAAALIPILWHFILQPYHQERILLVMDPTRDPLGFGWQTAQSLRALRNGGLTGVGLFNGPQTQSRMLPDAHNDIIFSVAGEELGMLGALGIFVILLAIAMYCLLSSLRTHDTYTRLICVGVGGMILFQTFNSIGMSLGLTPIIGLTLPFFSYGGSSVVSTFFALGIVSATLKQCNE